VFGETPPAVPLVKLAAEFLAGLTVPVDAAVATFERAWFVLTVPVDAAVATFERAWFVLRAA